MLKEYKAQKRAERMANAVHVNNQMMVISNDHFFTEDNPNGFISKGDFKKHIDSIIDSDYAIKGLETFFNHISDKALRLKISNPWISNKTNKSMYFIDFYSRISRRYAVDSFEGLDKLIDGVTHGRFVCELDLDGLFARANQAD